MTALTEEKPQQSPQPQVPAQPQDKRPGGTMFDPETIRKFVDQIKKDGK